MHFLRYPIFIVLFGVIGAIVAFPSTAPIQIILICFTAAISLVVAGYYKRIFARLKQTLFILFLSFSLFYLFLHFKHYGEQQSFEVLQEISYIETGQGEVHEILSNGVTLSLHSITEGNKTFSFPRNQKILLKTDPADAIPGQIIKFSGSIYRPFAPASPYSFDYRRWLELKGVTHIVSPNTYKIIRYKRSLFYYSHTLRSLLAEKTKPLFKDYQKEFTVAMAITYGDKMKLSKEVKNLFRKSGTAHVLAVSGLHVGIIYGILSLLLFKRSHTRSSLIQKAVLGIIILWFYALTCGLSTSVNRSALMFSILLIGQALRRPYSTKNSLGIAALILLFYNPSLFYDIGFQFSFLAVGGILCFHRPLSLYLRRWIKWRYAADAITITLVAQLSILPLSLFYFHTFPVLFLPASLIAVPLTAVVMGGMLLLSILSFIYSSYNVTDQILFFLSGLYVKIVNILISSSDFFSSLSISTIDALYPDMQFILLYFITLSLAVFVIQREKNMMPYFAIALIIMCSYITIHKIKKYDEIIYTYNDAKIIDRLVNDKRTLYIPNHISERNLKQIIQESPWNNRSVETIYYSQITP